MGLRGGIDVERGKKGRCLSSFRGVKKSLAGKLKKTRRRTYNERAAAGRAKR